LELGPKMLEERKAKIVHTRNELTAWLTEKKYNFIPPQANFIMIETGRDAKDVQAAMLAKGVAIGRAFPALNKMIRVSIGTDAEMAKFRSVFAEVLS
jgi:histidinol-phosphate aminotransferase